MSHVFHCHKVFYCLHVFYAGGRRDISPIHEAVKKNILYLSSFRQKEERFYVLNVAVNPSVRKKSEDVK